jgi:hypothetical protein
MTASAISGNGHPDRSLLAAQKLADRLLQNSL